MCANASANSESYHACDNDDDDDDDDDDDEDALLFFVFVGRTRSDTVLRQRQ